MRRNSSSNAVLLCWVLDAAFAGLFALGIAGGIASVVKGHPDWRFLAALVVAGLGRALTQAGAGIIGMHRAHREKQKLRRHLLPNLLRSAYVRGRPVGEDVAVLVDAIELTEGFHARFAPLKRASVTIPFVIAGFVAFASPVSAGILVATLLPFGAGMALAGIFTGKVAREQLGAITHMNGLFLDRLRALAEIRLFKAEKQAEDDIREASETVSRHTLTLLRTAFLSSSVIDFFAAMAIALVAIYTGLGLLDLLPFRAPETFTLEKAFFALTLAPEFYQPMRRLAAAYHDRQQNEAAQEALSDMATETLAPQPRSASFRGLSARQLTATHKEGPTVGPVTFSVAETGLVALTGPTGSGKSTLLAAIAGLLPHGGALEWPAGASPEMAWSGQTVLIVEGTLRENIGLWAADTASPEEAARLADLSKLIGERGLDAPIDWRGSGLSGGERRRIGLARAVATGRPLILLDEPTADLDQKTARSVAETIRAIADKRAVIVATHDPVLAALADHVTEL